MSELSFVGPEGMEPWMLPDFVPDVVCEQFRCETCGMAGGPVRSPVAVSFKMKCHCGTVYEVTPS